MKESVNISIREQFRKIINTFYSGVMGEIALTSDEYSHKVSDNHSLIIGTSFRKDVWLSVSSHIEKLTDELYNNQRREFNIEYKKTLYSTFSIYAYEILRNWKYFKLIEQEPPVIFLKHIKNASLNENSFLLYKEILPKTIIWRDKKLTVRRNEKKCFFKFMKAGDLLVLFEDIYKIIAKHSDNEQDDLDAKLKAFFYKSSDGQTVTLEII